MTSIDRRQALGLVSGSVLIGGCRTVLGKSSLSEDSQTLLIRPRWVPGEEAAYKTKYIQAVTWLKANDDQTFPSDDPRSYLTWKKILLIHQKSCQHSNWFLMPWHRLYLLYFEAACQYALQDETFALPYWDWTLDPEVPKEFYEVPVLQSKRDLAQGSAIPPELVGKPIMDKIMGSSDFFNFHSYPAPTGISIGGAQVGQFEGTPHNGVHNTVGGIMGSTTDSPTDPIFWLHHSNIDRLWALWLAAHPDSILPFTLATAKEIAQGNVWASTLLVLDRQDTLPGFPPMDPAPRIIGGTKLRSAAPTTAVKDLLATDKFAYTYESIVKDPAIAAIALGSQVKPTTPKPRSLTILKGKTTLRPDRLTSRITLSDDVQNKLLIRLARPNENAVSLSIVGLPVPSDVDLRKELIVRFFLLTADTKPFDFAAPGASSAPEYVGSYTFFPMGLGHKHAGDTADLSKVTAQIDIAAQLSALLVKEKGRLKDVSLVAVPVLLKKARSAEIFKTTDTIELNLNLKLSELL